MEELGLGGNIWGGKPVAVRVMYVERAVMSRSEYHRGETASSEESVGRRHQQKNDLRPADATRVRTDCVRHMRPVRPDRPPDVFSHPMRLVPPNALIRPPMHPARLLRLPSVLTPPSFFPSSTALV